MNFLSNKKIEKCYKCGQKPNYVKQTSLECPYTIYHYPMRKVCDNKFCWHEFSEIAVIDKWNEHNKLKQNNI